MPSKGDGQTAAKSTILQICAAPPKEKASHKHHHNHLWLTNTLRVLMYINGTLLVVAALANQPPRIVPMRLIVQQL